MLLVTTLCDIRYSRLNFGCAPSQLLHKHRYIALHSYLQTQPQMLRRLLHTSALLREPIKSTGNRFAVKYNKPKAKPIKQDKPDKYRASHKQKVKSPPRRQFEFNTGSIQAQTALKDLIIQVKQTTPLFTVKFVNQGKLESTHLVDICNSLDLTKSGLLLIKNDEGPMVKTVKVEDMITNFTDKLALQKEQELLDKGSRTAHKVINQRLRLEKKKSALKVLNIFWKISQADLANQKRFEIERRLQKGERFTIFLKSKGREASKEAQEASKEAEEVQDEEDTEEKLDKLDTAELSIELQRRDMIFKALIEILDEMPCTYKVEGKIDGRMSIVMVPEVETVKEVKKVKVKELKEVKIKKEKVKKVVKESDLDSLYDLKIED